MEREEQFYADVIHPWMKLDQFLTEPIAIQSDRSSVLSDACRLAVAIKHQVDLLAGESGIKKVSDLQKQVNEESTDARLISDIADHYKHGKLSNHARESSRCVRALFEGNDNGQFCFLRNEVHISHATLGEFDFMEASLEAAKYWIAKRSIRIGLGLKVQISNSTFSNVATLHSKAGHSLKADKINLITLRRNADNSLTPADFEVVSFQIL